MRSMKQLSLAETGFLPRPGKQTWKAVLQTEMETIVPGTRMESLIKPFFQKKRNIDKLRKNFLLKPAVWNSGRWISSAC